MGGVRYERCGLHGGVEWDRQKAWGLGGRVGGRGAGGIQSTQSAKAGRVTVSVTRFHCCNEAP